MPITTENQPRYVVGIDLGTTNSAVCYVDTAEEPWRVRTFTLPQLVAAGQVEGLEGLPSFHYQPAPEESAGGVLRLPWEREDPDHVVGVFAREQGKMVPVRAIQSAKSWLSHPGVDRTAALLPWHGAADVERLSPVDVSARYLRHMADAWNHRFPEHPFASQDIVLTLPASFDEVARELTVKAAHQAGLPRVVLIEEPQAAFYAWIDAHRENWERHVAPGQKILVCDIGGGTTDFTLIRVRRGEGDKVQFHRVAVGEHLILGGDNLDLALAHHLERKLKGDDGKLEPRQWSVLVRTCRAVKETLLGENAPDRLTVTLPGAGSRLIGGGIQVEVAREEAQQILVDGFLPRVGLDAKPQARRSGFQEFGLPYAPDAAMSRYLAAFLTAHRYAGEDITPPLGKGGLGGGARDAPLHEQSQGESAEESSRGGASRATPPALPCQGGEPYEAAPPTRGDESAPARPDIVLFNGGFFASSLLRERLLDQLRAWFRTPQQPGWEPLVLRNDRLDLAVARGAAYYGMVRRGVGVRISAGLARTYYIGIESDPPTVLCLLPAGAEPGQEVDLTQRTFHLLVASPVEFPLYVSSTRLTDRAGELVPFDREQMTPLPPVRTVLRTRKKDEADRLPVHLRARLTEIGTLDFSCHEVDGPRSWRLQFDVRSATQTDVEAHAGTAERQGFLDVDALQTCRRIIDETFNSPARKGASVPNPAKWIAAEINLSRDEWPTSLLRGMWEALMEVESGRRRSPDHEARWLGLLGFSLRPGYGLALDDWRVAETWRALNGRLVHATPACRAEWWILWRRIAGGLQPGWQISLATPLLAEIRQTYKQFSTGRGKGGSFSVGTHEQAEVWRLLGSLELLGVPTKIELGNILLDLIGRPKLEAVRPALEWALGRVAARSPVYGPLNAVIPADRAADWARTFLQLGPEGRAAHLALMQIARRTDDRFRDLPDGLRNDVADWLTRHDAPPHYAQLVREGGTLEAEEQGLVFGEALPRGLRIL